MRIKRIIAACLLFTGGTAMAQINANLLRYPDVSKTSIVFTYANDIWIVPKTGGTATRLTTPKGEERYAKFSPDGKSIAFSGNYDGNLDVYVMPVSGGIPVRLTSHGNPDRVIDWTTDGKSVVFASSRNSGKARFSQFYQVKAAGGPVTKMPFEYAEYGSFNNDGNQMAVVFLSQASRTWKRYQGGMQSGIHIYDLKNNQSKKIAADKYNGQEYPMWYGENIYYVANHGKEQKMNLWSYHVASGKVTQLTNYKDEDISFPSLGDGEIVFQKGADLHIYDISSKTDKAVKINIVTDLSNLKPRTESVANFLENLSISPDGNRILVEARGDLFSVPAKDGFIKTLTATSGVAERYPAWAPNGRSIAYWSDVNGEYELYVKDMTSDAAAKKITNLGPGYKHNLYWSPDSKKISFIDNDGKIYVADVDKSTVSKIDQLYRFINYGTCENFRASWSPDSKWMAYSRDIPNTHTAVFIYDVEGKNTKQVTSGFYSCSNPVFDVKGKYLFLTTNQVFSPTYGDFDNTFVYNNSTKLAAIALRKDVPALLKPTNDTVAVTAAEEAKKTEKKDTATAKKDTKPASGIDFDNFESRLELLSPAPGNIGRLASVEGKILFLRSPNRGESGGMTSLKFYDIESKTEKTIAPGIFFYELSANGKKLLVNKMGEFGIINPGEGAKMENPLRTGELTATIDPKKEWKQIMDDAWRFERDYFYDKNLHGVDWNKVKVKYNKLLEDAVSREDLSFLLGELIGELNASHTYNNSGPEERGNNMSIGYLGVDWVADGNYYKISKIIKGAGWDNEVKSPLSQSGIGIEEGNYILAVNGVPLTTATEPYEAFSGLANRTIELTYNTTPSFSGAKTTTVKTLTSEYRLRNLAWIESMRAYVDKATNGEVGYVYVPSTGIDGQNELMRMFNAQMDKKALIIDERFNDGGQIPDRFIEMLERKPLAFWATRDSEAWNWPPAGHFGPKVMLVNGWSGSGGDAFPDYFKKRGLGPLIGTRTWGGLIGISGTPSFVDGGSVTVPTFRMYNPDGTWFREGHGVEPDIEVVEDLGAMSKGVDVQLNRAIEEIKKLLKTNAYTIPARPAAEKR